MHLSVLNWMRAEPLITTLRRMRDQGYESLIISGDPEAYPTDETRELLRAYGITCQGAVTLMFGDRNLGAKNPDQRAASVDYVKSVIDLAAAFGGETATVVPGTVGKTSPDGTPEEEWRWVVESVQECFEHAWGRGIKIAIEPLNRFEAHMINRTDQALALADAVSPEIGVCLDTFHMNIEESDLNAAFKSAEGRLFGVHIADNNRLAAGLGSLDWQQIVGTLKEIGYRGPLSSEFVAPIDRTPSSAQKQILDLNPTNISQGHLQFILDHSSGLLSEQYFTQQMQKTADTIRPLVAHLPQPPTRVE